MDNGIGIVDVVIGLAGVQFILCTFFNHIVTLLTLS